MTTVFTRHRRPGRYDLEHPCFGLQSIGEVLDVVIDELESEHAGSDEPAPGEQATLFRDRPIA